MIGEALAGTDFALGRSSADLDEMQRRLATSAQQLHNDPTPSKTSTPRPGLLDRAKRIFNSSTPGRPNPKAPNRGGLCPGYTSEGLRCKLRAGHRGYHRGR